MREFRINLQLFADTSATAANPNLVQKAWAKQVWEAGKHQSFFEKFMGTNAQSIVHVKEELTKTAGDQIFIPLLMPLRDGGVEGDDFLEGNEAALTYREFSVTINQLRNAVRLVGRFDERKTQIDMRSDARNALAEWLAHEIDIRIFTALSTDPTADRVIYGGSATSEATVSDGDRFSVDLIGKAKRLATADEDTMIRPVRVDGNEHFVLVIDQWQARDLTNDQRWIDAQQYANVRGNKNPIFSGALGMYEGVIIHMTNRVLRTETGATNGNSQTKVGHALLLGAQACVFAEGEAPRWEEKTFDYNNKAGFAISRMFGIKKSQFAYNGTDLVDYGVVNILTSSVDD